MSEPAKPKPTNQTEAIRAAFDELGTEADNEAVRKWVEGKKIKTGSSFDTIVSHERRKRRPATAPNAQPSYDEVLEAVKQGTALADDLGRERLCELVEEMERLYVLCGGWENIRKMLLLIPSDDARKA